MEFQTKMQTCRSTEILSISVSYDHVTYVFLGPFMYDKNKITYSIYKKKNMYDKDKITYSIYKKRNKAGRKLQ